MIRAADSRYLARLDRGTPRSIVTPEGTALEFVVASAGDRFGAFLLDFLFQFAILVALVLLFSAAGAALSAGGGLLASFVLLAVFLVQNFYFIFFEARGRGMTPGKRRVGIRVMDARGGPLTTDAVVVRNLVRNLEIYIPLAALLVPEALWPGAPGWATLLAVVWMLVLAGLPLFNRRRLRVGDMIAGTLVVLAPRPVLLSDVVARETERVRVEEPTYVFTEKQLSVYGIYELQVLEDLLRKGQRSRDYRRTHGVVADKIVTKIEWERALTSAEAPAFLRAFYAALRAHLEKNLLFGKRKEDKFSE